MAAAIVVPVLPLEISSFLANPGTFIGGASVGPLIVQPNYPVAKPTTFDSLRARLGNILIAGQVLPLPAGAQIQVRLLRNGLPTSLIATFPALAGPGAQAFSLGSESFVPGDTFDLQVALVNTGTAPLTLAIVVDVSATLGIA